MENLNPKKKPWLWFWKTEEEKQQDLINKGYYWAMTQFINGKIIDEIRNWSGDLKDSENLKMVNIGIEEAIIDFQEIVEKT